MKFKELNDEAMVLYDQMNYKDALIVGEKALEIAEADGKDNPDSAIILSNLGLINNALRKKQKAEVLYNRAIDLFEKHPNLNLNELVRCLNNLANLLERLYQEEAAERYYKRALLVCEKLKSGDNFCEAMTLNNLGGFYIVIGNLNSAEEVLNKAISIIDKKSNNNELPIANIFHNLGWLYSKKGMWTKAESFLRKSLKIQEDNLGSENPKLKQILSELITVLANTKNKNKGANRLRKQYNKVEKKIAEIQVVRSNKSSNGEI